MSSFHINTKGDAGICKAKQGKCPFGAPEEHYATAEEARRAFENSMEQPQAVALDLLSPDVWEISEEPSEELAKALDMRFNGEFGAQKLTVKTLEATWDGNRFHWEAAILNGDGQSVGMFKRALIPGSHATNEWMSLQHEARGHGFATQFTEAYDRWLKELNISEVRVYAASRPGYNEDNILDGAYHWAKTYQWDKKPIMVISELWNFLEERPDEEEEKAVNAILRRFDSRNESDWPTPKELSEMGPHELGKRILTRKVTWDGKRAI